MFCFDEYTIIVQESLRFGFFTPEIPSLIYYSHITAVVVTLLVGIFVYVNNKSLPAKILLSIAVLFSILSILDIFLWTVPNAGKVMFLWSFWLTLFILIFGLSFYFLYSFIYKKDLRLLYKILFVTLIVIVELLSSTTYNLSYIDLAYCEAAENFVMLNFVYVLSFIIFCATVYLGFSYIKNTPNLDKNNRNIILLATIGISSFLLIFSSATYLASFVFLLFKRDFDVFVIEQYGYFGMTIFIALLAYTIVQYRAFRIKLIATSALVIALILLIASQFLFVRSYAAIVLSAVTLLLSVGFGFLLIQSVRREVKQREEIEKLAVRLEKANKRLKVLDQMKSEFVSIASHQLRSPLTSIRGYASMLLEGSFGALTQKGKEAVERIAESSRFMALSVEDYLNVSRIEAGRMKYEMSDFNLKDMAEHLVDDLRQQAVKKGLVLTSKTSELSSKAIVNGDIGKTNQIIHNLIDNALKYTPKGTVVVRVRDNVKKKRVYIDVVDSGVGMDTDAIEEVFEKFVRARNANQVNVTGTGLGLYVAKKMAEGMGGTITADSEGEGKGSVFTLEMPMAK